MSLRSSYIRIRAIAWAGFLGLFILIVGAGIWSALVAVNLRWTPAIPWSVPAMILVLSVMWAYMAGKGWPARTAKARRLDLRAKPVSASVLLWSLLAGILSVASLAGLWIVMVQLVKMPGNALPDFSRYPLFTVAAQILMGSLAAPLTEEPAFRGYCQVILEREFNGPTAVLISSVFFALAHGPTQGFLWPKLLFYFLVGAAFGTIAHLTGSILPAIPSHVIGLLLFFSVIWPHDAARRMAWNGGANLWFWLHIAQILLFAGLALWSFRRLARVTARDGIFR
jgi:membrane protease YdiL (CAAX protease family)